MPARINGGLHWRTIKHDKSGNLPVGEVVIEQGQAPHKQIIRVTVTQFLCNGVFILQIASAFLLQRTTCRVIDIIQRCFRRGTKVGGGVKKDLMMRRYLESGTKAGQGYGRVCANIIAATRHGICAGAGEHNFLKTRTQQQPVMEQA